MAARRVGLANQYLHRFLYRVLFKLLRVRHAAGGPDYCNELVYWDRYLRSQPPALHDASILTRAFPNELRSIAKDLQSKGDPKPKLLEVGSGPTSILAAGKTEGLYDITAIDPLARMYNLLLKGQNLSFPIVPRTGNAENLKKYFARESFDIIYSSNALDHVVSPQTSLEQMCELIRPGGFLMLEGFVREGSHGNWGGLHQHDIFLENGYLMHDDRTGKRSSLSANLPLECVSQSLCLFRDRGILGFGYELPDFPDGAPPGFRSWENRDWYTVLFRRC